MNTNRVGIFVGWGINAEQELGHVFARTGWAVQNLHVNDVLADPGLLRGYRVLAFPGGFSFGDHLGSGQVLAHQFRSRLRDSIEAHIAAGGFVIGICNGFQVLVRMGLLPNLHGDWRQDAALVHNSDGQFVDEWVDLAIEPSNSSPWLHGVRRFSCPIRHGEGRFVWRDAQTAALAREAGVVALRYAGANPNGSTDAIAGITDRSGRVFGLMPHPEAFIETFQPPNGQEPHGLRIFSSLSAVGSEQESRYLTHNEKHHAG